jgi:hypothetical protein
VNPEALRVFFCLRHWEYRMLRIIFAIFGKVWIRVWHHCASLAPILALHWYIYPSLNQKQMAA